MLRRLPRGCPGFSCTQPHTAPHELGGGRWRQVADTPGTLTRVTQAIASAGVNVQSLAVGGSEQQGRSRITMVIPRDQEGLPRLTALVRAPPRRRPTPPRTCRVVHPPHAGHWAPVSPNAFTGRFQSGIWNPDRGMLRH